VRIAWFSPIFPSRSGIAAYTAEILPILRARHHHIDVFVDRTPVKGNGDLFSAHDYVWKQRRDPYDVTVFQLGNATCHDYMWGYLFNFPGMVVLHDAQLHQARALSLTRAHARSAEYVQEFLANHPDAPPDLALLVLEGMMGDSLYQIWPHTRLVAETARLTVVHNARVRNVLAREYPAATFDAIAMGVGDPLAQTRDVQDATCTIVAFGGVTPEKRIVQVIRALASAARRQPNLRLVLVGQQATHFDVMEEAAGAGVADRVTVTGYVPDTEVPKYLAAADICVCLRWPTNRETSASWLRCLAAGKPTLVTELSHLIDVPMLDPQTWQPRRGSGGEPVAVSIDLLDEQHSIQVALERLASDGALRARLGAAARAWWHRHHRLETMADDYERVLTRAASLPPPERALPHHLQNDGTMTARALADRLGVAPHLADLFR
jgi:glycosyltransferase involved in cell wall biosynthesis